MWGNRQEPTVLIVGGKLKIVRKARALGLRVVYVQQVQQFVPEHRDLVASAALVDYTNWSQLRPFAEAAYRAFGYRAAVSLTEPGLEPASRITDLLGLTGNPLTVSRLLRDKWAMRQHLSRTGGPTVAAAQVSTMEELVRFGKQCGYPLILKPRDGTASVGVFRIDGLYAVPAVWHKVEALRRVQADLLCPLDVLIAEEFVDGPEYSVETFSFAGRHVVVAVTEKVTAGENFTEVGHALPARLDPADEMSIVKCVTGFLDAVGLRHGPAHTEVRTGTRGPRVIESHNRVGGGRICEMVDTAFGIDLDAYALGWPFDLVPELPDRPAARCATATRFLVARPGKVGRIDVPDEVRAHPAVVSLHIPVAAGDVVPPAGTDLVRLGQLIVRAADTAAAVRLCDRLIGRITVEMKAAE